MRLIISSYTNKWNFKSQRVDHTPNKWCGIHFTATSALCILSFSFCFFLSSSETHQFLLMDNSYLHPYDSSLIGPGYSASSLNFNITYYPYVVSLFIFHIDLSCHHPLDWKYLEDKKLISYFILFFLNTNPLFPWPST